MATVQYAQINIGRNEGTEPMSPSRWLWFVSSAQNVLVEGTRKASAAWANANDTQVMLGRGEWQGTGEDAAYISLYWEDGIDVDHVREQVGVLCRLFGQDAIALVLGSDLVTP